MSFSFLTRYKKQRSELCLYKRKPKEALAILLGAQPPLIYEAVITCIRMFQWKRALDLAKETREDDLLGLVLRNRAQYLQRLELKEEIDEFLAMFREIQIPSSKEDFVALEEKVKRRHTMAVNAECT